jgi:hypothetical protein
MYTDGAICLKKIGVYGVVLTAHVVLNGAKETYTLKM